eukprot:gene28896-35846_t
MNIVRRYADMNNIPVQSISYFFGSETEGDEAKSSKRHSVLWQDLADALPHRLKNSVYMCANRLIIAAHSS